MRAPRAPRSVERAAAIVIVLATIAGGAARVGTVGWGEPFLFHPDERGFVMWEAAAIEWRGLSEGDWRPRSTTYGPLIYEVAIALKWTFLGGIEEARREASHHRDPWSYVSQAVSSEDGVPFSFWRWTFLVRMFGAIGSTIAILLFALAAWRLSGPRAGAIAAILAASSVGLVQASHFATTDSYVLVEIAMLLHACAMLARGGGRGSALYAGIAIGLIAATKATGLLLAAALPFAIASHGAAIRARAERDGWERAISALFSSRFAIAIGVGAAVYATLCPWGVFDRAAYEDVPAHMSGTAVLAQQYADREYGFYDWRFPYNGTTPYLYHLSHVLPYAVGIPVTWTAIASAIQAVRRRDPALRIALAASLPTFVLVGGWGVKTIRYALPMVPGMLLGASALLAGAAVRSRAGAAITVLVLGCAVARGAAWSAMFLEPDPRVLAGRWVLDRVERGDAVVVDPEGSYTAPLGTNDDGVGVERAPVPGMRIRRLWQGAPADVRGHVDALLRDARFVVVGELYRRRAMHPEASTRAPLQARFYRALFEERTGFVRAATFARAPRIGAITEDESDAEPFAVAFDHMPVYVFERRGDYVSPF